MKFAKSVPALSIILTGFTAIIGQVILIRELLITFTGNELAIGIFFANLLFLEAIGSFIASQRVEHSTAVTYKFIILQILLGFSLPLTVFMIRIVKTALGILPGESINLLLLFLISLLLLLPFGLLNGALFSYACRLLNEWHDHDQAIAGKVYVLESAGSIAGGLIATYLALTYLTAFQTTGMLILLILLTCSFLLSLTTGRKNKKDLRSYRIGRSAIAGILLLAGVLLACGPLNDFLQRQSIRWHWPGYEVLSYHNSIYGNVTLLKQMDQYILLANGIPTATFPVPDIAAGEDFAHLPFLFCNSAEKVLLVGGGFSGVIGEILKHPVQQLDYCELDPLLQQTVRDYVPAADQPDLDDRRVIIHTVDGRFFLQQSKEKYDMILLNLPDPANLEINRFYTADFFKLCRQRLNASAGLLVFQIPGSATYLNRELINLNGCLLRSVRKIFRSVLIIPDETNLFLATDDPVMLGVEAGQLIERFKQQNIPARMFTPVYLRYKLSSQRQSDLQTQILLSEDSRINTDLAPIALYYSLAYHHSVHSPRFAAWMQKIPDIPSNLWLSFIVILSVLILWSAHRLHRRGAQKNIIVLPVIGSGFIGLGIPVVFVLLFQSLFGYVYMWIGLLVTAFMTGMTAGGLWSTHELNRTQNDLKKFIILLLLLAVYLLMLMTIFIGLKYLTTDIFSTAAMKFFILAGTTCCGFLIGAQFPLANKIYLDSNKRIGQSAGLLYSADLAGAWLGGIIVTAFLIPVYGIINTVLVFLAVNLISLCSLHFAIRR